MTEFGINLMRKAGFEETDFTALMNAERELYANTVWNEFLRTSPENYVNNSEELLDRLEEFSKETGIHKFTLALLHLAEHFTTLDGIYRERGIPEEFLLALAQDIYSKNIETKLMYGVCGMRCYEFYIPFFNLGRFAIGRLEYEYRVYNGPTVRIGGIDVKAGDHITGMHIPSGSPLTREACLESLKNAFTFFGCTKDKPLIVHCNTWLLNPAHTMMLSRPSNLLDFMDMFHPVGVMEQEGFPDGWRLYGHDAAKPVNEWPENNRLQRGYKAFFLAGGKMTRGIGVLVFDGENLL